MDPHKVLKDCAVLIGDRGADYGGIEDNFTNIATIASIAIGKKITAFDVAMILASVKLARIRPSPGKSDNFLDLANYAAFAHELRPKQAAPQEHVEINSWTEARDALEAYLDD